jgi:N-acetylmuramoyl-L-alanine amidase
MPKYILALAVVFSLFALSSKSAYAQTTSVTGHKIVIDAGHGGTDPGTTQCPYIYESEANLIIANKLKALLETDKAVVYMTREDNSYKTNEDRYTYANSTDGEILVSIHLNGSTDHKVNGTKGLYSKPKKDKILTTALHNQLYADLGIKNLGITNFMSGVILKFNKAATLQEAVYLSNTTECYNIKYGTRTDEIALSLYKGLVNWFTE